ncbi:MAG: TerB family tellurite resistance protein [Bacteroidales bacterium]|jgi:DnaJ like chaperone protein|nr:TerB family tellurite resistance protein [Bacteroidales bacterium]HOA09784.1 TerB family tellurite resistance protein [Tenuifilaceae bacterium]MBP8642629.1 TerB family tellurite resistance protein [Bacteroidales bacterium]NLI87196.1 DnaJ domain-containing protein [Bacteroidales bacterium]HOC35717.1 TerB family tellurite resistance protein [Tenuifilaceae bacterium]
MGKYGKWISGGLGWALFGPIGAILGFAIGSIFDSAQTPTKIYTGETSRNGFLVSLLVLVSAVMKADGRVLKSELSYVKDYFYKNFGASASREAILLLRDILKQSVPVKDVCKQVKENVDYHSRLQMLHFLFGIAQADGVVSPAELQIINEIAQYLGVETADFDSIKAMFIPDTDKYYKILEVSPSAANDEIKKAYRQMAIKYHPDKVSHLGEDVRQAAEQKFKMVNEAYEKIKKERGFN